MGEVEAIFPYVKTEEREKIYYYTDIVFATKSKFFYNKVRLKTPPLNYQALKDLKAYKIGSDIGYWYVEDFE